MDYVIIFSVKIVKVSTGQAHLLQQVYANSDCSAFGVVHFYEVEWNIAFSRLNKRLHRECDVV